MPYCVLPVPLLVVMVELMPREVMALITLATMPNPRFQRPVAVLSCTVACMPVPVPLSSALLPLLMSMRDPVRVVSVPLVAFSVSVPRKIYIWLMLGEELVLLRFSASETSAEVVDDVVEVNLPEA